MLCVGLLPLGWPQPALAQITTGGSGDLFRDDVAGTRVEPAVDPVPSRFGSVLAGLRLSDEIRVETNLKLTFENDRERYPKRRSTDQAQIQAFNGLTTGLSLTGRL